MIQETHGRMRPPMDLRNLPEQLSALQRINQRRALLEQGLDVRLSTLAPQETVIGDAEKKNCEQMFGTVNIPVGYAGPLKVTFSNGTVGEVHLPLATTEGALVASVNRGCKAVSAAGASITRSEDHGITRSIALRAAGASSLQALLDVIRQKEDVWKKAGEATSQHLKILSFDIDISKQLVFLTIAADTDEAMGMNMVTIAAEAIAQFLTEQVKDVRCITIAGNVDSDKKPSKRTHQKGRGYEVVATASLSKEVIADVLKTTPEAMLAVAKTKLVVGSEIAGAIGKNLHAANILSALYLATGQDVAHVVEGSLTDTSVEEVAGGIKISVRVPAILVGVRGGGTVLPCQQACLEMLLKKKVGLHRKKQLAESMAAAVLAGEISLLAAQASGELASAHKALGR